MRHGHQRTRPPDALGAAITMWLRTAGWPASTACRFGRFRLVVGVVKTAARISIHAGPDAADIVPCRPRRRPNSSSSAKKRPASNTPASAYRGDPNRRQLTAGDAVDAHRAGEPSFFGVVPVPNRRPAGRRRARPHRPAPRRATSTELRADGRIRVRPGRHVIEHEDPVAVRRVFSSTRSSHREPTGRAGILVHWMYVGTNR